MNNKNRFQGTQNDIDGEGYQIIVRDYLEEFTGVPGISKVNHGIDVEVEKYKVEVKGMNSLFFVAGSRFRYGAWKFFIPYLKEELTHFCFVLDEHRINSKPLLYFVTIEIIKDYIHRWKAINKRSEWIRFPIYWVLDSYSIYLSRIGEKPSILDVITPDEVSEIKALLKQKIRSISERKDVMLNWERKLIHNKQKKRLAKIYSKMEHLDSEHHQVNN